MDKVKKPFYKRWWFIAIVVLVIIGAIGNGTKDNEGKNDEPIKSETSIPEAEKQDEPKEKVIEPVTPEDEVKKIITDTIGDKNNMKKDRIVEVIVNELADDNKTIAITLNASENATNKMTRRKMWMDSVEILEPLSAIKGVENISVEWLYPLADQYGNTEDGRIMMFDFPKEVFEKVNWENFNVENMPNVSTGYFEHPALNK